MLLAANSTGCLVTSVPEYEPPTRKGPFLLASSALPDTREILELRTGESAATYDKVEVEVEILSEDYGPDDVGLNVATRFYLDYGRGTAERPFALSDGATDLPKGRFSDGFRRLKTDWTPRAIEPGCHSLTLMATHEFVNSTGCPRRLADSDQITWQMVVCPGPTSCIAPCADGSEGCIFELPNCQPRTTPPVYCPAESP